MSVTALLSEAQCSVHQTVLGARRPGCLTLTLTHLSTDKSLEMTHFIPPADAVRVTLTVEKLPMIHGWNWQQILYQYSQWAQLFSYHFMELSRDYSAMQADGNLSKQNPKTSVAQSNTRVRQVRIQTRWTKEKKTVWFITICFISSAIHNQQLPLPAHCPRLCHDAWAVGPWVATIPFESALFSQQCSLLLP